MSLSPALCSSTRPHSIVYQGLCRGMGARNLTAQAFLIPERSKFTQSGPADFNGPTIHTERRLSGKHQSMSFSTLFQRGARYAARNFTIIWRLRQSFVAIPATMFWLGPGRPWPGIAQRLQSLPPGGGRTCSRFSLRIHLGGRKSGGANSWPGAGNPLARRERLLPACNCVA